MFGVGNTAAQPRGMQQPPAQPLSSSQPNLRAQVPPPLLSPQVKELFCYALHCLPGVEPQINLYLSEMTGWLSDYLLATLRCS